MTDSPFILGISAYYHDSAAALIKDGRVVAAAHEERFTRKKHDESFPIHAIQYVLDYQGIGVSDLKAIAFYDKPYLKFERLLDTYHCFSPRGITSYLASVPVWIKEKLALKKTIRKELASLSGNPISSVPPLVFPEHHLSHAASAFYPSPFQDACILTIDGVGEWATTTICHGIGHQITNLKELQFPHSLGLLYSTFTGYCGFKVNSGEYKLMGLAPYGDPDSPQTQEFHRLIQESMVDLKPDGSVVLNIEYFEYATGLQMANVSQWTTLLGLPPRPAESHLTQPYMNLALAIQMITEESVLRMAQTGQNLTGSKHLVLAGGVALNCVANGKLQKSGIFEQIWIQPAAGDAGGALGSALAAWHIWADVPRAVDPALFTPFLGPEYSELDVAHLCRKHGAIRTYSASFSEICTTISHVLADGKIVGWIQGRMEWGPRALGNRSILGDARQPDMQKTLNLKTKYREGFRPFAPAVLAEKCTDYFKLDTPSPYMLLVAPVVPERRCAEPNGYAKFPLMDRLYHQRSDIPAVTHIDYSARVQTVHSDISPEFHQLLSRFQELTGCGVLVNTSFNVRGEPIVMTPEDAYRCFMRTEMDYLVIGHSIFAKIDQPKWAGTDDWQTAYRLD